MGECSRRRGGKCKFRHLSQQEYEHEIYGTNQRNPGQGPNHQDHSNMPDHLTKLPSPDPKRPRMDSEHLPLDFQREGEFMMPMEDMGREVIGRDLSLREFRDRDRERDKERDRRGLEEMLLLRKQIDNLKKENASLKKEVSDLRATNEFLLDQVYTVFVSWCYSI